MKKISYSIFIVFLLMDLFGTEFHVDRTKDNMVKFISDAPIENFEGVTDNIDGYLYWKSVDDLTDNQLYFEVDLTTIDTGIELRNRHMRDNYLETDKYRYTFFEGKIDELTKVSENEYDVSVSGKLFIHGITNEISTNGKIIRNADELNIQTEFTVALSDYNIDIPQIMFMKIDENMQLHLNFYLNEVIQKEE